MHPKNKSTPYPSFPLPRAAFAAGVAAIAPLALHAAMPVPGAQPPLRPNAPNVLLIMVDDMNDWVGHLGANLQTKTPNIDRLAGMGVAFTRAYCAAPVSCPSRAALLSGQRPSTSGVYTNDDDWRTAIPAGQMLTRRFRDAGYVTVNSGKIMHGKFPRPGDWDSYFNLKEDGEADPAPKKLRKIAGMGYYPLDAGDEPRMMDYRHADRAIEFLAQKHDSPFFLGIGFHKPHLPWTVPKKYFDLHPLDQIELPPFREDDLDDIPVAGQAMSKPERHRKILADGNWKTAIQAYLAAISFADAQVGRVLDALESSPARENTIIVFLSDHGWALGEKYHWQKSALWEEETRAPMVWVVPGVTRPGARCDRVVEFTSVYPTLLDLCRLPAHASLRLDSPSLAPLLQDPRAAWDRVAVTTMRPCNHAARDERWHYIRYADGTEELYDTLDDPHEWTNLAVSPEHAAGKTRLAAYFPEKDNPPVGMKKAGGKNKKNRPRDEGDD
jgi:arylsulfatase A-like enzyme